MILIHHHLGLGDHIVCNGLVRNLIQKNQIYGIFVKKHNVDNVMFMYKDLKNLKLKYSKTRRNYEVHRFNPILGKLHLRTQKNYSFLNNVVKQPTIIHKPIYNQTIRHMVPLIKNNSMIKINPNALHRFTRYGRRRR